MMIPESHKEFLKLYQPIHERFVRYCSSNAYGLTETDDLVQETVLATLQQFHRIHDRDKLLPYMIGIANNILKNLLRRKKFKGVFDEKAFGRLESRTGNPEIALDIHYLYKALNKLPVKDKQALILFEVNGFSIREISEMYQLTEGATKTRFSRARQKLKELMSENFDAATNPYPKTQVLFSFLL